MQRTFFEYIDLRMVGALNAAETINNGQQVKLSLDSGNDECPATFIKGIFHNLDHHLFAANLRTAFPQAGVQCDIDAEPSRQVFDESIRRGMEGFTFIEFRAAVGLGSIGWVNRGESDDCTWQ
jgi:hypothetical protein